MEIGDHGIHRLESETGIYKKVTMSTAFRYGTGFIYRKFQGPDACRPDGNQARSGLFTSVDRLGCFLITGNNHGQTSSANQIPKKIKPIGKEPWLLTQISMLIGKMANQAVRGFLR